MTLEASILTKDRSGKIIVDTFSDPLILKIRGDRFSVTSKIKTEAGYETKESIEAGDPFGITFEFDKSDRYGRAVAMGSPYELRIYNAVTGAPVANPVMLDAKSSESYVFKNQNILSKAGVYRFEFRDDEGFYADQEITVLPSKIKNIRVTPSSTKFVA